MKSILNITCILLLQQILFGGTTGKLSGILIDKENGEPLIGCNIILEGTYHGTASNEKGEYILLNLPPGLYTVRFEMIGYKKMVNNRVSIFTDKTTTLNGDLVSSVIAG